MSIIYIHLSDIHFGQEKNGGQTKVNDDVKDQLLIDAREYVNNLSAGKAEGIIISGDIAYAGKPHEYEEAGNWLDRLTAAVGCAQTDVQVVPGNHDIDRDKITPLLQREIDRIIEDGDDELDMFLDNEYDRELIYRQFLAYRTFAEGYDCPLDNENSGYREISLAENRKLKFFGLNTSLICSNSKKEHGGLMLGKRQRVLPVSEPGTELIVIAHHPLNWLQDSEDAMKYIKSRARIFISGHEHQSSKKIINLDETSDLLMIASGATVPPGIVDDYNYCYNIIEFEWVDKDDDLKITIHERVWDDEAKAFALSKNLLNDNIHILKCPNFKKAPKPTYLSSENMVREVAVEERLKKPKDDRKMEDKKFEVLLLKFFRDLSAKQRLSVLINLGAIPDTWEGELTHALERLAFDKLFRENNIETIEERINQSTTNK